MNSIFSIFTKFADWLVYGLLGLSPENHWASSLQFFIDDTTKIFAMLFVIIYIIGYCRAALDVDRVRDYLQKRHRVIGYVAAAIFGAITPFCSCSSIPLFLGFTAARIPVGITMAFLITSPMINEVAVVMLGGMLGMKFTIVYVGVGLLAGIIGGAFFDLIRAERFLTTFVGQAVGGACSCGGDCALQAAAGKIKMTHRQRHDFAKTEVFTIVRRIWIWIIIGVGAGAALHGFVPREWVIAHLGGGQWWTVPAAVMLGIPLYANATGVIPVAQTLIAKGLPVGTTLAFMMSTVAASLPEFIMLKQVMKTRLLVIFFLLLLVMFTCVGWLFNYIMVK